MDFQTSLKQTQDLLQKEFRVFFAEKNKAAGKINSLLNALVDQIADLTLRGGKRMRPFLCWMGYNIVDSSSFIVHRKITQKELIDAMLGLELFHSFALIHDDIIDQDKERRKGPTIHDFFNHDLRLSARLDSAKRGGKAGVANNDLRNHFGQSVAILAGDLTLTWSDERMSYVDNPRIFQAYQQMKEQVILGQSLDVMRQFGFADISQTKINELKTAWYSVVWPLTIGALLANTPQKDIFHLQRYGLLVGKAYQLRDDLMDGDITKKDFFSQTKEYKRNVEKVIDAFPADDQRKKLLSDVAAFVVMRHL